MLDSAVVENASKVRPAVSNAIEWAVTAWNELSAAQSCWNRWNHAKNCWNHAKILPRPVTSGPVDATIDELTALLMQFADSSLDVDSLVNHVYEQRTEELELDDDEATAAYAARDTARHQMKRRLMTASLWSL